MKKLQNTIDERFDILKKDEEIKGLIENAKIAEKSEQKDNLRRIRSNIEWRIRDIIKPNYLWFHTSDWLMTIWFTQENWKVRYTYLNQDELNLVSAPIYSCQTQFHKWYALVQDPETLIWSVINKELNKIEELHDYNWVSHKNWESKDFFELRIKLSNYLRTFEGK